MGRGYRILVKDIVNNKVLKPDDEIQRVYNKLTLETSFKSNSEGEEHMHVFIDILRWEPETDDEYATRMKREEEQRQAKEQKDRDEYIRLKAKFES